MPIRSPVPVYVIPALMAVGAAAALGGATLGEAVGASAPVDRGIGTGRPEKLYDGSYGTAFADNPHPDQYALVTPEGRFETGELSTRGLYSQDRFGGPARFMDPLPGENGASDIDLAAYDAQDHPDITRYSRAQDPAQAVEAAGLATVQDDDDASTEGDAGTADLAAPNVTVIRVSQAQPST